MSKHDNERANRNLSIPGTAQPAEVVTFYALQRGTGDNARGIRLLSVDVDVAKTPVVVVHPYDVPAVTATIADRVMTEAVIKS